MASRDHVLRALSDRHLRAIGKVAAQWSSLEFNILHVISDISRVDQRTTMIMVAAQGFVSWCELLKALSGDVSPKPKPKNNTPTALESLVTTMMDLHKKRNNVVHCSWDAPYGVTPGMGLFGMYPLPAPKAREQASGRGLKKRQADPVFPIAYSATEMLSIARDIRKAETALLAWSRHWLQAHAPKIEPRIGQGLLAQAPRS